MGKWIEDVLEAIKRKKELPQISLQESDDEEMDEDIFSEELGDFGD